MSKFKVVSTINGQVYTTQHQFVMGALLLSVMAFAKDNNIEIPEAITKIDALGREGQAKDEIFAFEEGGERKMANFQVHLLVDLEHAMMRSEGIYSEDGDGHVTIEEIDALVAKMTKAEEHIEGAGRV